MLLLYFDAQRTSVALQFASPMTQKSLDLVKEWEKYWNVFNDKYVLMMGDSTLYVHLWNLIEV
jgi:hypothetical protein